MTTPTNASGTGAWTPGPWKAIKGVEASDDMRCGVSAMRGDVGYLVATIENGAPGDICDTEFANARLIAASPRLLGALETLVALDVAALSPSPGVSCDADEHDAAIAEAHAAIAEARGDS